MKHKYKFIDKSVYLEKEKILVIGDLHLGYEERLLEKGISVPPICFKEIMKDLERIFSVIGEVEEVVVLGDLKHDFAGFEYREADNVLKVLRFLKEKSKKITVIKGNHDNYVISALKKEKIKLVRSYEKNNILFMHGDKKVKIKENIKMIVLGHMHPAISIKEGVKKEIYKCFLEGKWKGKKVIVLPSFFPLFEGTDIFEDKGEFLAYNFNLKDFEVYVPVSVDEVLEFGKVRDVGRLV